MEATHLFYHISSLLVRIQMTRKKELAMELYKWSRRMMMMRRRKMEKLKMIISCTTLNQSRQLTNKTKKMMKAMKRSRSTTTSNSSLHQTKEGRDVV